ncbi:HDOD domain-containing protein [bacterium]|nr:HDOD domain-containing protein [bacterium]
MSTTSTYKSLMDLHPREVKNFVKDVPTLPVIYQELFAKMQDPNVAVPEIAEIITHDQALSTKILHLVNSAFYGYSKQIKTISRAVVILGFRAVRSAALATSVFDYFKDEEDGSVDMMDFWKHSIAVASICKVLAEELNINQKEEAFVVGLLHDIGKLVEKRYFDEDFREVCTVAREQHLSWIECEKALFQTDHANIGKAVFRGWNFPPSVIDAVQFHHTPNASAKVPQLTSLVHVADFISYQIDFGAPGAFPPRECSPEALKMLGLTLPDTLRFHDKIREELEVAMEILKLLD